MTRTPVLVLMLVGMGIAWGLTIPLAKIAVSEGYRNFGIIFWQTLIGAALLGLVLLARRRLPRWTRTRLLFCAMIALTGTICPTAHRIRRRSIYLPAY